MIFLEWLCGDEIIDLLGSGYYKGLCCVLGDVTRYSNTEDYYSLQFVNVTCSSTHDYFLVLYELVHLKSFDYFIIMLDCVGTCIIALVKMYFVILA